MNQRRENQEVAVLIARFKTPEAANKVIRDGIVIQGKRVKGNKMTNGPIRCFHCQRYGHFAANCPQKMDPMKCPTCTGPHRREECEETRRQDFKCPNCKKKGHAAWDPECEHHKEQLERLIKVNKEMQYRYYPTDEEWTWEKDPDPDNPERDQTAKPGLPKKNQGDTSVGHGISDKPQQRWRREI